MNAPADDVMRDKAAALDGEFIQAGTAGGGGADTDAPPSGPSTGEIITGLLRPTFDILAPAWEVSDIECAMLGNAYGEVIDKYFPDFDLGPEVAAIFVTVAVFAPRMKKPMRHPKPDDETETRPG